MPAAVLDGRLEGELLVWTVVLMQLCVPHVLEGGSVRGYAGVKERVFGAEEDGLLLPGVDQMLFTARAPGRSLGKRFRSLAFSWNAHWLFLHLHFDSFALLSIHQHGGDIALCHL